MENEYRVVTDDKVSVVITTKREKCIPTEKTFSKKLLVKDIKDNLEIITGACSSTMKIQIFDKEDKFCGELDNDMAVLGSYPLDNGMRLHIDDQFLIQQSFEDESSVEKYEMPVEEYEKRDESNVSDMSEERNCGPIPGPSRGRGRPIKNNIQRLHGVETTVPLRRPKSANLITDMNNSSCSNPCSQELSGSDIKNSLEKSVSSLSVDSSDTSKTSGEKAGSRKELNPDALEFVPSWIPDLINSDNLTRTMSKIEIIDPETNLPVELDNPSHEVVPYSCFVESSERDVNVTHTVSQALKNNRLQPSGAIDYDNEVNNMLDVVENMLVCNPGLYSTIMTVMSETFDRWMKSDQALSAIARKIIHQCTTMHNYSYFCAKICSELDRTPLTGCIHKWFRGYILSECEIEYNKLQDTLAGGNYREAYGVISFFAELYIQLTVKSTLNVTIESRIKLLGESLLQSLSYLVSGNITTDNISCLCRVLKLSGWALDEDHPDKMKSFLDSLRPIKDSNQLDESVKSMLNGVLELSSSSWGLNAVSDPTLPSGSIPSTVTPADCDNTPKLNGHQGYNLQKNDLYNELGFSEDEIKLLEANCDFIDDDYDSTDDGSDDWDDEISEAYNQFLLTIPSNKERTKK